jgi:transposase
METNRLTLGIDIAKQKFDVALLMSDERFQRHQFNNNAAGFEKLSAWLQERKVERVHACMEATGRYGEALALYLYGKGHTVSVVNPTMIHHYALSELRRNKTDRLDAEIIARYCSKQTPRTWEPTAPEVLKLQEMVKYVETLQRQRTQVLNRLSAQPPVPEIRQALGDQLALLDQQIAEFLKAIHDHIDSHPDLHKQRDLLVSIPGIAEKTASEIISFHPLDFDSARAFAAFAGLSPQIGDSGSSVHHKTRLCKIGNANLRHTMYMPALAARRYNVVIKKFCDSLAKRGKPKMVVIGAAMRKLLCLAYGVLKSGKPFDPDYALKALA